MSLNLNGRIPDLANKRKQITAHHEWMGSNATPSTMIIDGADAVNVVAFGGLTKLEHVATHLAAAVVGRQGYLADSDSETIVANAMAVLSQCAAIQLAAQKPATESPQGPTE